jgi:hypothetical protein
MTRSKRPTVADVNSGIYPAPEHVVPIADADPGPHAGLIFTSTPNRRISP